MSVNRRAAVLLLALACAGCGRLGFDARERGDATTDASADAFTPACETFSTWSTSAPVAELDTVGGFEVGSQVSASGLAIYFSRNSDLYVSRRASRTSAWDPPQPISELNTGTAGYDPTMRPDELELYFTRPTAGDCLYTTRRPSTAVAWAIEQKKASFCSVDATGGAYLTPDGLRLYYTVITSGNSEGSIYMSTRTNVAQDFQPGVPVMVMTAAPHGFPSLSADEKTVYFELGGTDPIDLYEATRPDTTSSFGVPVPLTQVNTSSFEEEDISVTADGLEMFFDSDLLGDNDIFTSTRSCL